MRVKDVNSNFCIVKYSYWLKYGENAFVERTCKTLEEAEFMKNSIEKCDGIRMVVIDCEE